MKKAVVIILVLICSFSAFVFSQEAVLTQGDIDLFIQTFPLIRADMENLGMQLESVGGGFSLPQAALVSEQTAGIFKSNGWTGDYLQKIELILYGSALVQLESEFLASMPEIEAAIKEIDATPVNAYFTIEMKQQTRDAMLMAIKGMNAALFEEIESLHPADADLLRQNKAAIFSAIEVN